MLPGGAPIAKQSRGLREFARQSWPLAVRGFWQPYVSQNEWGHTMARMQARAEGDQQWISISGHLTGRDLGRLERLCARRLAQERLRLTLRLAAGTQVDGPAQAYVERLARRGATVLVE